MNRNYIIIIVPILKRSPNKESISSTKESALVLKI